MAVAGLPASNPSRRSRSPAASHERFRFDSETGSRTPHSLSCLIAWWTAAFARPVAAAATGSVMTGWAGRTSITAQHGEVLTGVPQSARRGRVPILRRVRISQFGQPATQLLKEFAQ